MMGIVVPETRWAYKKYNKITSGIKLVFYSLVITMMHGPVNISAVLSYTCNFFWSTKGNKAALNQVVNYQF